VIATLARESATNTVGSVRPNHRDAIADSKHSVISGGPSLKYKLFGVAATLFTRRHLKASHVLVGWLSSRAQPRCIVDVDNSFARQR
jgi:hypothetical protein